MDSADLVEAIDIEIRNLDSPAVLVNRQMLLQTEEPIDAFRAYMVAFAKAQSARIHSGDVLAKVSRFGKSQMNSQSEGRD